MTTNSRIIEALRLATEHQRFTNMMDIAAHRTRQGHWHPRTVPCTSTCPVGDPRTQAVFLNMLRSV